MNTSKRDALFANPLGAVEPFQFNQSVVDVFPDMLKRSIPGYETIIAQSGLLATRYAKADTQLYDLGCSLGATAISMEAALGQLPAEQRLDNFRIVGVDNSTAMLTECERVLEQFYRSNSSLQRHIDLQLESVEDTKIENASVVALNFTLQFVPEPSRNALMARIYSGMRTGGVLILSEKIAFPDARVNEQHIEMYHAFKSANGYSDLEIAQKRTALENVLVPETLDQHQARLQNNGFTQTSVWFQCFNFASMIAIK
ncbi:MAG: carboxy-S-adenosyl-L-methionine synthase CmoA [Gammaproteobacteria bacterium]|nr:carboxy-S-adenosyl-L-methionine synthase CmoA [Gammaproteobacteria bacterium]